MTNNAPTRRAPRGNGNTERAPRAKSPGKETATRYRRSGEKRVAGRFLSLYTLAVTAARLPSALAQSCIPLTDSSECRAFNTASISTDSTLTGLFPFLANVTDTSSFDTQLQQYISNGFIQQRYSDLIGCSSFDLSNSSDYYARYTSSVLCNAIVQNSISACDLTGDATRPLCANTCAEYAESEQAIAASDICGQASSNAISQIRADFTNCALPANSLSGSCIAGVTNEPNNCGFSSNLVNLCSYCAASSPNATDSCCVYSNTTSRCDNVVLPIVATSSMQPLFTSTSSGPSSTATRSPSSTASPNTNKRKGLSGGAIAGIVIGSLLGAFILLALLILACIFLRRRKQASPAASVFNQPVRSRQGPAPPAMAYRHDGASRSQSDKIEALPGGRVARMTALEAVSSSSERNTRSPPSAIDSPPDTQRTPHSRTAGLDPPPRRNGSLSSGSLLAFGTYDSPARDGVSSPEGTSESEQLSFFKDYYSEDDIHPGDLVSSLWAYQPRAADEFDLERGDMVKVVGIWDDGWATGVRVSMRAEDWKSKGKLQRDSGMSSGEQSPEEYGPVKAFPLVCVCLPQHWRRTIEGDSTDMGTIDDRPNSP
ncbi:hypothetical protein D6D23_01622 [Aureobasidium pullulans]|uniref:SH3 domain-containing protein n=1 Tax=Aureobasidium pullulans TaxID=5580 RepID=A0A4S8WR13_AURPU|nr:hypothetical protein D6D24_02404 [Aureobasidium pullulans]THW28773.1 hypothetical protein D6D23_01622 [Aureobasidium pullulans]